MFNFWWLAKQSGHKMLTEMQKNKKGPLSHRKIKCSLLDYVQLLMIGQAIRAKNVDRNAKKWKWTPKSSKNKMFIFGLHSTSDDRPSNPSKKMLTKTQNNEKGPLSHWKIKCSFLDYIQLLMISQAIRAKNVDQNTKKWKRPPKSSKNKWFILDYVQLLILAKWSEQKMLTKMQKNEKGPLSLKNKMFIFGLCLHSDDRLSDPGKKCWLKCKKTKKAP